MALSASARAHVEPESPFGESGAAHGRRDAAPRNRTTAHASSSGAHAPSTMRVARSRWAQRVSGTAYEESEGATLLSSVARPLPSRALDPRSFAPKRGSRARTPRSTPRFVKTAPLVVRVSALRMGGTARGEWSGPRRGRTIALTVPSGASGFPPFPRDRRTFVRSRLPPPWVQRTPSSMARSTARVRSRTPSLPKMLEA